MAVRFERTTRIQAPRERVFDLSLRVDLHEGSMRRYRERSVASTAATLLGLGDSVTWRAWHFGLPWTMTSRIAACDRPARFVDEQAHGPFAWFRHEHLFEADGGATVMIDRVEFRAPGGPFGRVAERVLLGRYLTRLIDERNAFLAATAEAEE